MSTKLYPQQCQVSPFAIHQIWMEGEQHLKEKESKLFKNTQQFKDLHDDHYLWSSKMIGQLIKDKYDDLLPIYTGYPYDIMRIHLAKYVILNEYGGFFIDIDCVPKQSLYDLIDNNIHRVLLSKDRDPYKKIKSDKKFLSNHFMFSPIPQHPLLLMILQMIPKTAKKKKLEPHLTHFLRSVGPYFLHKCVKQYKKMIQREIKSKKIHTSDVVEMIEADILDFYFIHDHLNECKLEQEWIKELRFHDKIVMSSSQVALTIVCVGAVMVILI
mmetsp:Transcript_21605/g.19041  ORF Transcript_21605/g.19041 Transcript_21605/m.19041 type:complete len:270 (-) Transcript_21605:132-941(-)